jgi:dephospho-CoA kinase
MENKKSLIDESLESAVVVAVTGGIASGKSEVARLLKEKKYPVISTDWLAKNLMESDLALKAKLISEFGKNIYTDDGKLNSKILSGIVFSGENKSEKLQKLNSLVHPTVIDKMVLEIENQIGQGNKLVFVESALIFESGLDDGFDYIIVVTADTETRIKRAMNRSELSREEVVARMNEQISQEEKIKFSDFEIQNNKSIKDLESSLMFLLPIIEMLPPKNNYSSDSDDGE